MADSKGKVLVVDDEAVVLKSCQRILEPKGYEVTTADSPSKGLEALAKESFDLIITDIMMPEMSGIEFIKKVRKTDEHINVVMITGFPSQESIRDALGLRIVDYLPKPFSPHLLSEVTGKAMAMKSSEPDENVTVFTDEIADKLDAVIDSYKGKIGSLIPVLQKAQGLVGYLPPVVQRHVARRLGLPVAEVHGVVSFYHFFSMKPKGKHCVKVCTGTACYVKRAEEIMAKLQAELGIKVGEVTEDRKFSIESVRCLGACGLAPVVVIDEDTYGSVSPVKAHEILDNYRNGGNDG